MTIKEAPARPPVRRPTQEEQIRYIRTEGYRAALRNIGQIQLVSLSDDSRTIRFCQGSDAAVTVRKLDDDTFAAEPEDIRLAVGPGSRDNTFANLINTVDKRAVQAIRDAHRAWNGEVSDPREKRTGVEDAINSTGMGVAAATAGGYGEGRARLMWAALTKFVGPETVAETIDIAGRSACLSDIGLIGQNRHEIEQARARMPNALRWFHALVPAAERNYANVAEEVRLRLGEPDDAELLEQLSPRLFREMTMWPADMNGLLQICREAGGVPSYTVAREILHLLSKTSVQPIFVAAARRSVEMRQRRQHGQRRLAAQIADIITLPEATSRCGDDSYLQQPRFLLNAYVDPNSGTIDWEEAAAAGAEARRHRLSGRNQPVIDEEATTATASEYKREPIRRRETLKRMRAMAEELAGSTAQGDVRAALDSALTVEAIDGVRLSARRGRDGHRAILLVVSDGMVLNESDYPDHETLPAQGNDTWRGGGLASWTRAEAVAEALAPHWPTQRSGTPSCPRPSAREVHRWLDAITQATGRDVDDPDEDLAVTIQRWLRRSIPAADVVAARQRLGAEDVRLIDVLRVRRAAPFVESLSQANALTAIWALRCAGPRGEAVRHPGQLVSQARAELKEAGFRMELWKRANQLGAPALGTILKQAQSAERMADMLNLCAEAGNVPPPRAWTTILRMIREAHTSEARERNVRHIINLYIREHPWDGQEEQYELFGNHKLIYGTVLREGEFRNACDYAAGLANEGRPCRSKSWEGLMRSSREWHRNIRISQYGDLFIESVRRRQGHYRRWQSALDEHRGGELTGQPVSDERALLEESQAMRHCVATYADHCASGKTRIFRILRQGEHIGTTQLVENAGEWRAVQTQGKHNREVSRDIHEFANGLAERYGRAWLGMRDATHNRVHLVPISEQELIRVAGPSGGETLPF